MMLYNHLPSLDLHGYDRDYARLQILEFLEDQHKLKNKMVLIVHGRGSGILRKMTQETLKKHKYVVNYKIDNFNDGMTVVTLK